VLSELQVQRVQAADPRVRPEQLVLPALLGRPGRLAQPVLPVPLGMPGLPAQPGLLVLLEQLGSQVRLGRLGAQAQPVVLALPEQLEMRVRPVPRQTGISPRAAST
jgi:hypothetical protein